MNSSPRLTPDFLLFFLISTVGRNILDFLHEFWYWFELSACIWGGAEWREWKSVQISQQPASATPLLCSIVGGSEIHQEVHHPFLEDEIKELKSRKKLRPFSTPHGNERDWNTESIRRMKLLFFSSAETATPWSFQKAFKLIFLTIFAKKKKKKSSA